jgi:hypothetical protein
MKATQLFMRIILAMAVVNVLALTGCPKDDPPEQDPALIGDWTNNALGNLPAGLVKTFTINRDFRFTASINPDGIIAVGNKTPLNDDVEKQKRWTVIGKLTADGDEFYIINDLEETTHKPAPNQTDPDGANFTLSFYKGTRVKITFVENKKTFRFINASTESETDPINMFFGGTYTKIDK